MQAKKNDTVYYAHRWNTCNVAVVKELVVTSWGKKRAQAKHVHNGEMLSKDLWLDNGDHAQVFATREEAIAYNRVELVKNLSKRVRYLVESLNTDERKGRDPHAYSVETLNDFLENGIYSIDYTEGCKRLGWSI